jgi:mycothiol synthase
VITIEPFDAVAATDDELRAYYDFDGVILREVEPDDPRTPFELQAVEYREPPSWVTYPRWIALDGDDIVGTAVIELEYVETNRHLAWFEIYVHADRRREGIGTRLAEPLAAAAAADGRTVLTATVAGEEPDGVDDGFLMAMGFEKRMVERRSRLLTTELDRPMLEEWVARAEERAAEYSLLTVDDACPDEILDQYIEVVEIMNTAPREDLDMEDWHDTPERVRENDARRARQRRRKWTLIARHDPTGHFAGFTEVAFADWMGDLMWQGGTAVDPDHRDRGLGRWLKAAMALRILDERPDVTRIDTWNAGSNRPMLAINIAMGFRPVKYYGDWQIATDALQEAVAKRR